MYEYFVKQVVKVVDGDTIDVIIDLGFDIMFASRVRLAGIDTPESRTRDKAEKALGLESKKYLVDRLKGIDKLVIKTEKINSKEKFGRVLGWLHVVGEEQSINLEMVDKGYAWNYLGATKVKDFDQLLERRLKAS
jgi:micrococcal nuclease